MANFSIPENPELNTEMRKLEETDPVHCDLFNGMFAQLLENDAAIGKGSIYVTSEDAEEIEV